MLQDLTNSLRRQTFFLVLRKIDNQGQRRRRCRLGPQDADTARFDQTADRVGRGQVDPARLRCQAGAIIGDQPRPEREKLQGQRRFA